MLVAMPSSQMLKLSQMYRVYAYEEHSRALKALWWVSSSWCWQRLKHPGARSKPKFLYWLNLCRKPHNVLFRYPNWSHKLYTWQSLDYLSSFAIVLVSDGIDKGAITHLLSFNSPTAKQSPAWWQPFKTCLGPSQNQAKQWKEHSRTKI